MKGYRTNTRRLLAHGANANLIETVHGWSPLHYAARFGHSEVASILLESGSCGVEHVDKGGFTPLFLAKFHGHKDTVKIIMEHMRSSGIPIAPQMPQVGLCDPHSPLTPPPRPLFQSIGTVNRLPTLNDGLWRDINSPKRTTWNMPLKGIPEMQSAIEGKFNIYAVDTSTCSPDIVAALEKNIDSGISLLDEHIEMQLNWGRTRKPSLSLSLSVSDPQ